MANALAAFILPTAGSGVNGPSITCSFNAATYQAPIQASIVELETALIGAANTSTTSATLTSLGCSSAAICRQVELKNNDATNDIYISAVTAPTSAQRWVLKPGERIVIPWQRVGSLFVTAAAGTPNIQWLGC